VAVKITDGAAFLTLANVIVSVKVLDVPSESVTTALTFTVVELVASANVFPANVIVPAPAFVEIDAISVDVAVNPAIVLFVVLPLYVSLTTTLTFENESIWTPVDFADTDCAFGVLDISKREQIF